VSKYLITGGTGFLGTKLIERLYKQNEIRVVARNEGKLIQLQQKFPKIEIITGNIADSCTTKKACSGVDGIFHLAAFKHVRWAEEQSFECIRTNVNGSINILNQGDDNFPEFILGISTDKAASLSGVYGSTKYLMEKLFSEYEKMFPKIKFRIVRYGNVLYSTGSVLCLWKELLQKHGEITITSPEATRFFWTLEQAVDLIFDCLENAKDSSPYVPEMKSMKMGDLLTAMQAKYGKAGNIKVIGLQPGENLHEKIIETGKNSNESEKFTIEEILEMI